MPFYGESSPDASFDGLIEANYRYKYVAPPVAEFRGDPADLVIDITKAPELNSKKNNAIPSSLVETNPSSLVAVGELVTNNDTRNMVNDDNKNVQVVSPPTPTVSQGLKRKARASYNHSL
jgi:hypothetical protein